MDYDPQAPIPILIVDRAMAGRVLCNPSTCTWPKYVISIGNLEDPTPPAGYGRSAARKLRLLFDDVEVEKHVAGYEGCTEQDILDLVAFCLQIADNPKPTLIHCAAGISRSSASALVLLAAALGPGKEAEAVAWLESARAWTVENHLRGRGTPIIPNRRVVGLADGILGRRGLLLAACEARFPYRSGS